MGSGVGMVGLGINAAATIPQVQLGGGWSGINAAAAIPQVLLPAGWNAPLANPVPVVPPAPLLQTKRGRGRGRGRGLGPLHDISGGQADLALNNLHRGHVALRERTAEYNAHVHEMQGQAEADKEYQQGLLQIAAEERKRRLAAAASERRLQEKQAAEEHGRMRAAEARALLEEIAEQKRQQKVAEDMAARVLMVQQLAQ